MCLTKCCSGDQDKMSGTGGTHYTVNIRNAHRVLLRKPAGKRPLERSMDKRLDIIKMNVEEIGWEWNGLIRLTTGTCGKLL